MKRFLTIGRISQLVFIAVLIVAVFAGSSLSAVKAWEGTIDISTYPWGPDDLNPKFQELEGAIYYPYPLQDVLSNTKENRTYKALFLENEYLKVICLPELGGRIHSVYDKTTREEMFERNDVIKPGRIGLRGAWICGGVEWNTGPQVHTVTSVSPVDALPIESEDGSASIVVGNTEKIFRTRWTIEVTLRPGRSFLEEEIRIYNPTDGVHPYYFWNNTGFPLDAGTRFIYPMRLGCDHSGTSFYSWPIHEGKDLSWLKNYDSPSSIFAYNCPFDFFGAYNVNSDRGIVQYADHHVCPGKKAWTWGESEDAVISQKALFDDGSRYIEVQSGPLRTQADYGLLGPREEIAWQEWWYPMHGLGDGFEFATKDVAVQTAREMDGPEPTLELRILATGVFPDSEVTSRVDGSGDTVVERVDLSPQKPATVRILVPRADTPVEVCISEKDGHALAVFTTPFPIPEITPEALSWELTKMEEELTVEELYLKGLSEDKKTNRAGAREWFHKALAKDASHVASLRGLAILDLESGLYEEAVSRLCEALERAPDDGMSWFYLGAARLRQGKDEEALRCGFRTTTFLPSSSIGYDLAGRALARMGEMGRATEMFEEALKRNARDTRAHEHLILSVLSGRDMDMQRAQQVAKECLEIDPLALLPRLVAAYDPLEVDRKGASRWFQDVFDYVGEKDFSGLEASLLWTEMGADSPLSSFLFFLSSGESMKSGEPVQNPVFGYYWLYFHRLHPRQGMLMDRFSGIGSLPVDYVLPSRTEAVEVFRYAIERNPVDAHAHLHLGNVLAGLGRLEEAVPHWEKAAEVKPALSVAQRNLGLYAWKKEGNLRKAEDRYRRAIEARPSDDTLYRDLARILIESGSRFEAIELLEEYDLKKLKRIDFVEILAQAYVDEKRYDDALTLLGTTKFSNWEARTVSRNTFVQAHMERGKLRMEEKAYEDALEDFRASLTYPEHLGVGRPAHPEEAEQYYWIGRALQGLGRSEEAREAFGKGADGEGGSENEKAYREKCREALKG